ncbi:hypothetical protein U27_06627 [Candidatus Vecturithrix granuli]|uniref:RelA/SpoT domain-containing protein n=1 Tax=Vecturithrix granuli TaxID=1499967 RepID=A0A081C4Y7_VECG1|nr:hypothetical protein U27_06627 [Candidatus Vecturithrix granuli]
MLPDFDPQELERQYRETYYPLYEDFALRLHNLVQDLTKPLSELIDKFEYRAKTAESFLGKLERKSEKYQHPFQEITDLAGVRVITFYQDSVSQIVKIIRREFVVDETRSLDKFDDLGAEEFGYQSVHLIVSLPESRTQLEEWKRFAGLQAEIQIRSILQHAWANMSHKFDYKAVNQPPRELRRRLFRLSALLELADEEFKTLLDQTREISQGYRHDVRRGQLNLPLNLDSLREFIREHVNLKQWEQFGIEAGLKPFPSSEVARKYFATGLEILLVTLQAAKISTIAEFERLLSQFDNQKIQLQKFVSLIKEQGETVHSLPLDVLILLVSFSKADVLPADFHWGGKYKPFFINALRDVCQR